MFRANPKCSAETRPYRFLDKILFDDGCWLWVGALDRDGYGMFERGRAHIYSYEYWKGPIPEGMFVCHSCDTPGCVKPDHLWLGTPKENMVDSALKGRRREQQKTHCPQGHPLDGVYANKDRDGRPARYCMSCNRERARARRRSA
jgi:hypothetical protein